MLQDTPFALVGARVLPIDAPVIEEGTVVLRDGRVAAVGPASEVEVPSDAEVVDAAGAWVLPGLCLLYTSPSPRD